MRRSCAGGCGRAVTKGRCFNCQKMQDKKQSRDRGTTNQRGYTYEYQSNRKQILINDDLCYLCGKPGADTADHIIPLSMGGTNDPNNLEPAHRSCNSARGNRM